MTNRLTVIMGVVAVVFAATTMMQTLRLWKVQGETEALRVAAAEKQKDAHKTEAGHAHGGGGGNDDFWSPSGNRSKKGADGETATDAKFDPASGTASGEGGAIKAFNPSRSGKKGVGGNTKQPDGTPAGATAGATADGSTAAAAGATGKAAGATGATGGKGGKGTVATNAKGKSADGKAVSEDNAAKSEEMSRSAQEAIKAGNFDQARAQLQQSVEQNPGNVGAWRQLASVDRQLGNSQEELSDYQNWIAAQPDDKIARYMASEAFARNGIDDQALQQLAAFQSIGQNDPQSYAMSAGIYQQLNMTAEQGAALQQWVAAAPTSPDAHRVLGSYYQQQGQGDQAIQEYQAMAQLQPNTSAPYIQMGNAYTQMGQLDAAEAQFQTAATVRPNDVEALTRLADTQRQLGDTQGALSNYQRVATIEPGSNAGTQAARNIQYIQQQMAVQAAQPATRKP